MEIDYIVVQAGGKGTRMKQMTYNKPKALVPVDNLPMIFHLFRKYPKKKFVIIGDYKYEVLEKYLDTFAEVDYVLVDAGGRKGTCAGIKKALSQIPEGKGFMLIWSDLILPEEYEFPKENGNYVGISKDFPCRWKYEDGIFEEESSTEYGVAGHFIFEDKEMIASVPEEGEFVRWLKEQNVVFDTQPLYRTKEYGILAEYNKLEKKKCRPFNRITVDGPYIIKEPIDEQGRKLALREVAWYEKVKQYHFSNIPRIYGTVPLKMEKIDGKNIYEYELHRSEKRKILEQLITCIRSIHALEECPADRESYYEAYIGKTFERLSKIYDLVPFAHESVIRINGEECPNVFFMREKIEKLMEEYMPDKFRLIHGDCTFSNMMLKKDSTPVMIDPRGYFGFTEYYGDPAYDWVKLYYSIVGNYDRFNIKKFTLRVEEREVFLTIESNHWEDMEEDFFALLDHEISKKQIKLLHALTWLSLTTYAWEDYDSICGAFYNGLRILKDAFVSLKETV